MFDPAKKLVNVKRALEKLENETNRVLQTHFKVLSTESFEELREDQSVWSQQVTKMVTDQIDKCPIHD